MRPSIDRLPGRKGTIAALVAVILLTPVLVAAGMRGHRSGVTRFAAQEPVRVVESSRLVVGAGGAPGGNAPLGDAIPQRLFLDQNYPNPFNPSTLVRYGIPEGTYVRITIHTLLGNPIRTLVDRWQDPGIYVQTISAQDLPAGVYFYRLQTDLGTLTRRLTVTK